ncbi:phage tail spike protein [Bacillus mobilis]|uniref:phage tail spike protein n=1 Tax=Bacillus mobilis TaxID=2026190 RepID=UPI0036C4275D
MRTPSGILHVVDFKTDQIVAAIQPKDYQNDIRHWEIKNNIDTLEFKTFDGTPHAIALQQQNLIVKEVRDGRLVPYVINNEVERDSNDKSITVNASGSWVQIAKDGYIMPQRIESKTVNEFIDMALVGMKWKRGITEYAGFHTMTIDEIIDPLTFLKKIASLFDLEIQYRVEVVGSQITGWYVDMIKKRGRETGKEVVLGKDLVGVRRIEHSRDICTALVGFVKGEGDTIITVEKINNGLPYITDSDAFQRWNEHGKHKFGFYTPETEDQNMSPERLMTLMKTEFKKRVFTSVSYVVEVQSIGRVFGMSHELINEGDTIRIKDTEFTPKLYLEARVIAGDESFTDPTQDKYMFGNYREIVNQNEELRKIYNQILSKFGEKQEILDQLDKLVQEANETASNAKKESEAAKTLAEKVQENIKNNTVEIIESKNPPTTGLKPFKTLWRDISNGKPGILKIWTGAAWESVVPDVESVKKETLDQVSKDIESTKNELNKKVQEAQNQATGQVNEVKESLQGVSRTISDVQNKQGEIDKKVTKFEQDSSGFKTSIESLTKKDTEISNKLNTVESTVEGTRKTISDVQQTTNDLKKVTTEMKEEAGKTSEKLTSVETKVNSDKTGGRNLLLKSNVKYEKTDYLINQYNSTENFSTGEEYTFVIKGNVPQGQKFGIWMNGGSSNVGYATSVYANGITHVTFKAVAATSGNERKLSLYNYPSSTTKSIVEWVALYKGNQPQDWTPPPEEQVTADEFTKKTTDIEKSVEGIATTVTNVQNSQAGYEKRMTTVEQTASGLSSTVSNLNNVVSDQGKKLTEANTKLEQQATAIGAKVELKQVENYVAGFKIPELKQTVDKNKQDLLGELANKLATEQFNQKMTLIDNRFIINEEGLNAAAKKTEVYTRTQADGQFAKDSYVRDMESRLQITERGVSISVKENDVIAAFNMSKENIKLNAARIDLIGKVNAEWIKAGLLSGCQIRTSNTDNYVSLDDQFIRLYEKGVARAFLGHYRRTDGAVQPTFILGSDEKISAPAGALFMSQAGAGWSGAYASIGIGDGIENGEIQKSVYWELQRNGLSVLNANDYHVFYAGNGSWYFRRGKVGLYQTSLVVEDNSTDSDLRLPNIILRNSRAAGYTGIIQVKSSVTQNGWGSVQGNFMSPSLREYKSNIRDVSFSALEKIRNVRVRQFNYKNAVNELYKMREERNPNEPPLTTDAIKTYYGAIVDECDEAFVDESGKGIHLYSYASIAMKGLQEVDTTVQEQEIEITNLKSQVASQEDRIAQLEESLQQVIDKKPEQL